MYTEELWVSCSVNSNMWEVPQLKYCLYSHWDQGPFDGQFTDVELMATKTIAQSHTAAKIQSKIQIHKSKQLTWASNTHMLRLELILCRKKNYY